MVGCPRNPAAWAQALMDLPGIPPTETSKIRQRIEKAIEIAERDDIIEALPCRTPSTAGAAHSAATRVGPMALRKWTSPAVPDGGSRQQARQLCARLALTRARPAGGAGAGGGAASENFPGEQCGDSKSTGAADAQEARRHHMKEGSYYYY